MVLRAWSTCSTQMRHTCTQTNTHLTKSLPSNFIPIFMWVLQTHAYVHIVSAAHPNYTENVIWIKALCHTRLFLRHSKWIGWCGCKKTIYLRQQGSTQPYNTNQCVKGLLNRRAFHLDCHYVKWLLCLPSWVTVFFPEANVHRTTWSMNQFTSEMNLCHRADLKNYKINLFYWTYSPVVGKLI